MNLKAWAVGSIAVILCESGRNHCEHCMLKMVKKESLQHSLRRETYVENDENTNKETKLVEKGLR